MKKWILAISAYLVYSGVVLAIFIPKINTALHENVTVNPPTVKSSQVEQSPTVKELYKLTNYERSKRGLGKLALSEALNHSASDKCNDMQTKNYWDHTAPDGTTPWVFIEKYTDYLSAGENLAEGFSTSSEVVNGWMNSHKHKVNILNPRYNNVGFSVCNGQQGELVVQHLTQL